MERPRPTPEKIIDYNTERSREVAEKSDEKIVQGGRHILKNVGLTIENLRGKKTLELASGPGILERAAEIAGIDDVISLELKPEVLSANQTLKNRLIARAEQLPLQENSLDLVISHCAPPISGKEKNLTKTMAEINRVLKENGEARMYPPWLGFISNLLRKAAIKEGRPLDQSLEATITQVSTEYLKAAGYPIELIFKEKKIANLEGEEKYRSDPAYWIFHKIQKEQK